MPGRPSRQPLHDAQPPGILKFYHGGIDMGRSGLEYLVQTSTGNGAAQTHRSSDFSEIKAIAKKHLGV